MSAFIINFVNKQTRKEGNFMCTILEKLRNKRPEELLAEYNIPLVPPIDLTLLLQNIGMSAIETDFSEIERKNNLEYNSILGATISKGENIGIFYRKLDTTNRQKFTIAHELAHCCLHTDDLKNNHIEFRSNDIPRSGKEFDANVFAGKLLVPEETLIKIYNDLLLPSLSSLMEIFQVSSNVIAARLDYLNLPYLKDVKISEN